MMKRREFLKNVAVASTALAVLPFVGITTAASSEETDGEGERRFQFVAFTHSGTDRVAANGEGRFKVHSLTDITGKGEGSFAHFHTASPVPPIAFGKWVATEFVSYDPTTVGSPFVGIYGRIQASRVVLKVNLLREFPTEAVIPAQLKLICNIGVLGAAGNTGEDEGYQLAIPGTPFAEGASPGPFMPLSPPLGLTHTSIPNTSEED